jgi:prepilin-type processing-associated H-X9-DG protein
MNMAQSVETAAQNNGLPDKITGVGDTSIMVLFADGPGNYCSVFPSRFPGGYNPVPRHNKSVNICFLDGHAAAISGDYIGAGTGLIERPDVRWHPPGNTWNSAQ